jgi:4-hydroxy-L-threonine phosphate dehydrogenase PdxA
MAMIGKKLRIFLVTTHLPLARAITSITPFALARTLFHAHHATQILLNKTPRIAVAALNPHAGEGGLFGNEEKTISPMLKKLSHLIGITPPPLLPADTVFYHAAVQKKYDAIVCLYHDQGLIPFKLLHFHDGVNLTVGLPFVRTSPDHGTAFDIAGKGLARPHSTLAAIQLAARLLPRWHTLPDLPTPLKKCIQSA